MPKPKPIAARRSLGEVRKSIGVKLQRKYHLKRIPKVGLGGKIKGTVFYTNPSAVPVAPGQKYFTTENIQWVSKVAPLHADGRGNYERLVGGFGEIWCGKVKFKGIASSKRVVLKMHSKTPTHPEQFAGQLKEIIQRLRDANIPHAKMDFLNVSHAGLTPGGVILMEPFIRAEVKTNPKLFVSKLEPQKDVVMGLDLNSPFGRRVFEQVVSITAKLSKSGMYLKGHYTDKYGNPRLDAFNYFMQANGEPKVIVEDLGPIVISNIDGKKITAGRNWEKSAEALLKTVTHMKKGNASVARAILREEAKKNHFGY